MKYLGIWFNPHLKFIEHTKNMVLKAMSTAHALRMLGNSIQGIHQSHLQ